jgi:hypothetical protein
MALNTHLTNTTAYASVVEALVRTGGTAQELSDTSGLAANTTRKFIRALRNRALVRVVLWRQDTMGRYTIAVWGWGRPAYDAKRPPRMTSTERSARRRVRQREMSSLQQRRQGNGDGKPASRRASLEKAHVP